jgi:regulator of sigma E protease
LGIGPRVFGVTKNSTLYAINLFPIGGYVRLAGVGNEELAADHDTPADQMLDNKSPKVRFWTIAMGAISNLLLAWLICFIMLLIFGVSTGVTTEIGSVIPNSPAAKAGLMPGDKVLGFNGKTLSKMDILIDYIHSNPDKKLTLKLDRKKQTFTLSATPIYNQKARMGLLGFSPKPKIKTVSIFEAITLSLQQMLSMIYMMIYVIFGLITGIFRLSDLAGPVGIAQATSQYYAMGALSFWSFVAFFNVNVGVLNLLPLPALDGGRLFFIGIEWLRKKPVSVALETKVHQVGMALLLLLILWVTIQDVLRLFLGRGNNVF